MYKNLGIYNQREHHKQYYTTCYIFNITGTVIKIFTFSYNNYQCIIQIFICIISRSCMSEGLCISISHPLFRDHRDDTCQKFQHDLDRII